MIEEIKQKFFETFEIPKVFKTRINIGDLDLNIEEIQAPTLEELYEEARFDFETPIFFSWFKRSKRWWEEYPEITGEHYIKLICLFTKEMNGYTCHTSYPEMLKESILSDFILEKDSFIKEQVQAIFKEN